MAVAGNALGFMPFDIGNILDRVWRDLRHAWSHLSPGGVFALMKKHYGLAVLGGVFSIVSILGLVGLILVIVGRTRFEK